MMESARNDNKRIAKNTIYMYIRMFITMLVGLYTSRVVLASLGFEDYGLYNVVGGIIAMFSFINGALANTTSRYITFYLGKGDNGRLREVFSTGFYIHLLLALFIVVLGETIGLWYVDNKLVAPEGRFFAACWLYQFTVIIAAVNIVGVPFNAAIISHEKMSAFALIAIIDAFLKLGIAISLNHAPFDKLIYYGAMLLVVQLLNNAIYWVYSIRKFEGIRLVLYFDRPLFREIFSFAGWNLLGNFSYVFFTQGVNLILNFFFGTAVNAARGIALQVESAVRSFANSVQTAINPQIIKSYAQSNVDRTFTLVFASSKYCYYLLFFLSLPIVLESEYILKIWLGSYPEHSISFLRITLASVLLEALSTPMFMANLASGKVKIYQICMGIISFVFIPITYLTIKYSGIPEVAFICIFGLKLVEMIARIFIVHRQIGLPRFLYFKEVLLKIVFVTVMAGIVPSLIHSFMDIGVVRFVVVGISCVLSISIVVYSLGINQSERQAVNVFLRKRMNALFHKMRCSK